MTQTIEQKIADLIEETVNRLGFDLVKVSLQGPASSAVEVLIDKIDDGKVSIGDCKIVSQNISALLDVEDIIKSKYYLEVSSAGVERPLVKFADYNKFLNREIKVNTKEMLNGCSRFQGKIVRAEYDVVYIQVKDEELSIPFSLIKSARLVLTEEIFRKLLKN